MNQLTIKPRLIHSVAFVKGVFLLLFIITMSACSKKQKTQDSAVIDEPRGSARQEEVVSQNQKLLTEEDGEESSATAVQVSSQHRKIQEEDLSKGIRKLVKEGSLSLKTMNIDSGKVWLDNVVSDFGGYYEKEDMFHDESSVYYNIVVRVYPEKFEALVSGIEKGQYQVLSKSIRVSDVTEETVDIQSRITSKKAYLRRYRELLSRAATIQDILEIEEIVRSLQEEIESQESRLTRLHQNIELSTLTLTLKRDKEVGVRVIPQETFLSKVKNSLSASFKVIENFVLWVIEVWPQLLVFAVILFFVWRRVKKYLQ